MSTTARQSNASSLPPIPILWRKLSLTTDTDRSGTIRTLAPVATPPDVKTYLARQNNEVSRLNQQRIYIPGVDGVRPSEVGIVESATRQNTDILMRVRFSESSSDSKMLAGKARIEAVLISTENGAVQRKTAGKWTPVNDSITVLPETLFTKIESPKERFRHLGIMTGIVHGDTLDPKEKDRILQEKRKKYQDRGTQRAHIQQFRDRIRFMVEEAANRRRLIQTYQITSELAAAYNRSKVFDTFHPKEAESPGATVREMERRNPFEKNLEVVAKRVLEEFGKYQYPSKEKIEEVVNLAAMDNEEINRDVFNLMVKGLDQFKSNATTLPNPHMVAGFAKMIRILPPTFLSEGYVEKVLVIIQNLGDWLQNPNHQFNGEGTRRDEMVSVFRILKQLLDGLVDNRQLQIIDQQNRYFTCRQGGDGGLPITELVSQLQDTLIEQSRGIAEEIAQTSVIDMPSLVASSFGDMGGSLSNLCDYLKDCLVGCGIKPEQRDAIKGAFETFKGHPDPDIRYLACYCREALARIPVSGESDIYEFGKRGLHLILGAKSLALIATSQGFALAEYGNLAQHLKGALQDSRISRDEWYDSARQLDSLIGEAEHDTEKHQVVLQIVKTNVINATVSWELVKMCLDGIHEPVVTSGNKPNQITYTGMLAQLFENRAYAREKDVRQLALSALIQCASDPDETLRELGKQQLQGLLDRYRHKKRWGMLTAGANLVQQLPNIQTIRVQHARVIEENRQDHALLKKAKETAFPIEYRLGKLRQAVEQFRSTTMIDEELESYVPLRGARSKADKDKKNWFMLQQRVDEFVLRDNRRRDRDGVLLNAKGEQILDAQGHLVTSGFHKDAVIDPEVLLIHGQAGAGKSLFSRYIERSYWEQYQSGGVVPLLISLPALQDPFHHGIEQALIANGFTPDQIQQLKGERNARSGETIEILKPEQDEDGVFKKEGKVGRDNRWGVKCDEKSSNPPRLLVILDGYDEIQSQVNLYQAYGLGNWKDVKVIVSVRTEYLEQMGSYPPYFKPEKGTLSEVYIRPFDESQQETYVRQILAKKQGYFESETVETDGQNLFNATAYMSFIREAKLSDFVEHPFMLKIIIDILPLLKDKKEKALGLGSNHVTRFEVYELFLTQWFEREGARIRRRNDVPEGYQAENSLWEYSTDVACFMYTQKRQMIQGDPASYTRIKATEADGAHFLTDEPKVKLSKLGAPIKKTGEARYAFIHKSIQEFLVAKQIVHEFTTAFEQGKPIKANTIMNQRHIQEEVPMMRFVLDKMNLKTVSALEAIVNQSQEKPVRAGERPNKSPIAIASANAMSLLVCRIDLRLFVNTDLTNIQIPGARLDGGYFDGVSFKGADLTNVSARQTSLRHCDWSGAIVEGVQFGQFPKINTGSQITSIAYSPDGKTLASGNEDGAIRLWDVETGKLIGMLVEHKDGITCIAYSPDGKTLASGNKEGSIRLWDVETRQPVGDPLGGHGGSIFSIVYSPDGTTLASGGADKTIHLWNVNMGQPIREPLRGHNGSIFSIVYSPDGTTLASGSFDQTIRLWNVNMGQPIGGPLNGHENWIRSIVYNPNGKTLASGSEDGAIRLWDVETGQPIGDPLQGHERGITCIVYSSDGRRLASGGRDKTIRLWDLETRQAMGEPLRGHENSIRSIVYSPDGKTLASGSKDKKIRFWDVETAQTIGESLRGHERGITSIVYSPDGKTLTSGSKDQTIHLWDVETGQTIGEPLLGHENSIRSIVYTPGGKTLASGNGDGTIGLWKVEMKRPIREPWQGQVGTTCIVYSPDRNTLTSGHDDGKIRFWNVKTKQSIGGSLQGHLKGKITSIVYSPDGTTLASGHDDGTIRFWNVKTKQPIGEPLRGHEGEINSIVYSPDGTTLASASEDRTIRLWDITNRERPVLRRIIGKRAEALNLSGLVVSEAVGLSELNQRLIQDYNDNSILVQHAAKQFGGSTSDHDEVNSTFDQDESENELNGDIENQSDQETQASEGINFSINGIVVSDQLGADGRQQLIIQDEGLNEFIITLPSGGINFSENGIVVSDQLGADGRQQLIIQDEGLNEFIITLPKGSVTLGGTLVVRQNCSI